MAHEPWQVAWKRTLALIGVGKRPAEEAPEGEPPAKREVLGNELLDFAIETSLAFNTGYHDWRVWGAPPSENDWPHQLATQFDTRLMERYVGIPLTEEIQLEIDHAREFFWLQMMRLLFGGTRADPPQGDVDMENLPWTSAFLDRKAWQTYFYETWRKSGRALELSLLSDGVPHQGMEYVPEAKEVFKKYGCRALLNHQLVLLKALPVFYETTTGLYYSFASQDGEYKYKMTPHVTAERAYAYHMRMKGILEKDDRASLDYQLELIRQDIPEGWVMEVQWKSDLLKRPLITLRRDEREWTWEYRLDRHDDDDDYQYSWSESYDAAARVWTTSEKELIVDQVPSKDPAFPRIIRDISYENDRHQMFSHRGQSICYLGEHGRALIVRYQQTEPYHWDLHLVQLPPGEFVSMALMEGNGNESASRLRVAAVTAAGELWIFQLDKDLSFAGSDDEDERPRRQFSQHGVQVVNDQKPISYTMVRAEGNDHPYALKDDDADKGGYLAGATNLGHPFWDSHNDHIYVYSRPYTRFVRVRHVRHGVLFLVTEEHAAYGLGLDLLLSARFFKENLRYQYVEPEDVGDINEFRRPLRMEGDQVIYEEETIPMEQLVHDLGFVSQPYLLDLDVDKNAGNYTVLAEDISRNWDRYSIRVLTL